jgi:Ser/Thr protein kinase RdoA (MazF antagonist)
MSEYFPVIYSTLSPEALASEILPDFDLGVIEDCEFYYNGFNDTYKVNTANGINYYLRVYRIRWRSLEDIAYELDVLDHLYAKGVPAIRPLPDKNGDTIRQLHAPEGVRYATLFTEAQGEELSYDKDPESTAFKYGQAVARIHNAVEDFSSQYNRFHIDLEHLIDKPLRNIQPFLHSRGEAWDYIQKFAGHIRQQITDLPASSLEQGFCHGDFQGYHANVHPDGRMTFYDFDCCGFGYRAYDLAVFRWASRLDEQENERWDSYLKGYLEIRPLKDVDLQAIHLFVCARYIWHMGVHTENAEDWGAGPLNDKYFDRRIVFLKNLEKDFQLNIDN